jgi:hypothetical protein
MGWVRHVVAVSNKLGGRLNVLTRLGWKPTWRVGAGIDVMGSRHCCVVGNYVASVSMLLKHASIWALVLRIGLIVVMISSFQLLRMVLILGWISWRIDLACLLWMLKRYWNRC